MCMALTRAIVVGARRRHQGTGAFIARALHRAGVEVAGVVGTSAATVDEACRNLRAAAGIAARGYTSLDAALRDERVQLVAICSPHAAHRAQLEQVAQANCHCLCEKPLWWSSTASAMETDTAAILERFVSRGLLLDIMTQWPDTLPAYDRLHGETSRQPLTSFAMSLSPLTSGAAIVPDCAPHVLSMLYALAGTGSVEHVRIEYDDPAAQTMQLRFGYRCAAGRVNVECRFATSDTRPRAASYAINGRRIDRVIRLPEYQIAFEADGRSIEIADPLECLVAQFVQRMHAGETTDTDKLEAAMQGLVRLAQALPTLPVGARR